MPFFARTAIDSQSGRSCTGARGAPRRDLGAPEQRYKELELAARVIYRETELDCGEARDLVGLSDSGCCG